MSASKRDALSNRHDPLDSGISAKAIFLEALEIPSADDRDQFIQGRCGGDESLGKEVWRLLAHHGEMGSFLQSPPQEAMLDPTEPAQGVLVGTGVEIGDVLPALLVVLGQVDRVDGERSSLGDLRSRRLCDRGQAWQPWAGRTPCGARLHQGRSANRKELPHPSGGTKRPDMRRLWSASRW